MSKLTLERALARDRWVVSGCLALIVALAWLWLWREWAAMSANQSMAGMDMPRHGHERTNGLPG